MYRGLSEVAGVMGGGLWCPLTGPQCLISFIRFCRDLVVILSLLFESVEISVSGGLVLSIVC